MKQELKERAKLNCRESPLMINLSLINILISCARQRNVLYRFSGIFDIKEFYFGKF